MTGFLEGRRVLVLEDEYLAALDVQEMIEGHGGTVVGPVGRLDRAEELARSERLDGAMLDVRLNGNTSYALARELLASGVVVIFLTGYRASSIAAEFSNVPLLAKPFDARKAEKTIRSAFGLN